MWGGGGQNVATREMECLRFNYVACTCKYCHQMGVYVRQPEAGGEQTARILNRDFIVTYTCEHGTKHATRTTRQSR
jgi:hypothetical protein